MVLRLLVRRTPNVLPSKVQTAPQIRWIAGGQTSPTIRWRAPRRIYHSGGARSGCAREQVFRRAGLMRGTSRRIYGDAVEKPKNSRCVSRNKVMRKLPLRAAPIPTLN